MEKEFIPYEQALELKELGFDEECIASYFLNTEQQSEYEIKYKLKREEIIFSNDGLFDYNTYGQISAPTFSQAFRWFRSEYALHSFVSGNFPMSTPLRFYYEIEETSDDYHYDTYEEAELACLKKLIEIVKNK
jgi:hypothetical protein